jgi:hypothetical protein
MTPRQLAAEVENAFDYRDGESLRRYLARLLAAALPINPAGLPTEQLYLRRDEIHTELAALNAELQRRERLRAGQSTPTQPAYTIPLEPTD